MHPLRPILPFLAASLILGAAGCSSPDSRIRAKPDLFASFTPEAQQRIRAGQIAVGFTEDMVRMAIGNPDRRARRLTQAGTNTVWIYTVPDAGDSGRFVHTMGYVRDSRGRLRPVPDVVWVDDMWRDRRGIDRLRVEFQEGKVTAIESIR